MKNLIFVLTLLLSVSCSQEENIQEELLSSLSVQEISDLSVLREEEKLARDVYLFAYDLYKLNIFINISESEQTHMDKVLTLLDTYGLEDS